MIIFTSVIGPALIIAGIALMGTEGAIGMTREDLVAQYDNLALNFAEAAKDFAMGEFSFDGNAFTKANKEFSLSDLGEFETYDQISFILAGVNVDNVTLSAFQIMADYPSAGQMLDFGTTLYSDTFTSTGFDLGCVVEGECDHYQGDQLTQCQQTVLCPKGKHVLENYGGERLRIVIVTISPFFHLFSLQRYRWRMG